MSHINNELCFNYYLIESKTCFEKQEFGSAKVNLQNAIRSLDELQDIKNKKNSIYETEKLLEDVARDPDKLKLLKRVVEAYE